MAKHDCDPFDYLCEATRLTGNPGSLLVTQGWDDRANVMAIGWVHIGVVWSMPVCIVYVRPSRHSYTCLEQLRQFTVNIPTTDLGKAVALCGTVSGRDQDKFAAAKLTAVGARQVKPPVIEECILHYECNVLHYNDVTPVNLQRRIIDGCYSDGDLHRCYFGEILATYGDVEALAKVSS